MSARVIEILGPNLPKEMRGSIQDDRFIAYTEGFQSEAMPYFDAVRTANGLDGLPSVGFIADDEEPMAAAVSTPDYSEPVPSYMSRRKRK
jgi:hypothetical protein